MLVALLLPPTGLTDGQFASGSFGQKSSALLIQVEVAEEAKVPEPEDALGRPDLVLVRAELLLHVADELLDRPSLRRPADHRSEVRLQLGRRPVAHLLERLVETLAHDPHPARPQPLHQGPDQMP